MATDDVCHSSPNDSIPDIPHELILDLLLFHWVRLSTIFLFLSLHLYTCIFPAITMFSSLFLLNIFPMNDDCHSLMDLIMFLSSLAFVRHSLFVILPVRSILNILTRNHISAVSSDLCIDLLIHCYKTDKQVYLDHV